MTYVTKSGKVVRGNRTLLHFNCKDCGAPMSRWSNYNVKKNKYKGEVCKKCINKIIRERNDGFTLNYTGNTAFAGALYAAWKSSAKRRNYTWDENLTKKKLYELYLKQDGKCALSGVELVRTKGSPNSISLDRIDSNKGYEIDNIQFVCSAINLMKNNLDEKVFVRLCKGVAEHCKDIIVDDI